ncbi:hypothetical protein PSKAS_35690 [Peribacillus sp. N1]
MIPRICEVFIVAVLPNACVGRKSELSLRQLFLYATIGAGWGEGNFGKIANYAIK